MTFRLTKPNPYRYRRCRITAKSVIVEGKDSLADGWRRVQIWRLPAGVDLIEIVMSE